MNNTPRLDLIPPPLPDEPIAWWLWSTLALAVIGITVGLYAWRRSPKHVALRQLRRIERNINNATQLKLLAFEICHTIKKRYAINHIHDIDAVNTSRWNEYKQRLNQACFDNSQPDKKLLRTLLDDAYYWITCREIKHD